MALGEAVNNAVEHAYGAGEGTFHVRMWRDGNALNAEVSDHGQWRPEREEGQGHGLSVMRDLADTVDVARSTSGTTVRLVWSLDPGDGRRVAVAVSASRDDSPHRFGDERGPTATGADTAQARVFPRFQEGRFAIGQLDGIPVINVTGDVDLNNARRLAEQLEAAARLDKRAVVVSLAGASFFDSAAIHVLVRFQRRLATNRQRLVLAVARDRPARRIIDLTGLAATIPVFETVEEAAAWVRVDR